MFSNECHDCNECTNLTKLLQDKETNITIYQNNLFELKTKILQSNDLISKYINYKKENENLKKELEHIKNYSETGKNSHINYEKELLRNKYLKECEKNNALVLLNNQITAMLEQQKNTSDSKTEILKLKKDVSEKERIINAHFLTIQNLKKEIKELKEQKNKLEQKNFQIKEGDNHSSKNINENIKNEEKKEEINKYKNDFEIDFDFQHNDSLSENSHYSYDKNSNRELIKIMNNQGNLNKEKLEEKLSTDLNDKKDIGLEDRFINNNYFQNPNEVFENENYSNTNKNIKNLIKENEFLKRKFQKYERKYIKHKSISKSFKKIIRRMKKENHFEKDYYIKKLIDMKFYDNHTENNKKNVRKDYKEVDFDSKLELKNSHDNSFNRKKLKSKVRSESQFDESKDSSNFINNEISHEKDIFDKKSKSEIIEFIDEDSFSSINVKNLENKTETNKKKIGKKKSSEFDSSYSRNIRIAEKKKPIFIQSKMINETLEFNENKNDEKNNFNQSYINVDESHNESDKEIGENKLIENFKNDDNFNIKFLQKKIFKKKKKKSNKLDDDLYEIMKKKNQSERRSLRIKINSLKKGIETVAKNPKKKNKQRNKKPRLLSNEIKKELTESSKEIINKNVLTQSLCIADMLKRAREGKNLSFSRNVCENIKILDISDGSRYKNDKNKKSKIEKKIQKEDHRKNNCHDDLEVPEKNIIIKINKHKDSHKNPIKFSKINEIEIIDSKNKIIKKDLLDYIKNKFELQDLYNHIEAEKINKSISKIDIEENSNFDLFSSKGIEIERIFNQNLHTENINKNFVYETEFSLYEKIYCVFDLIFENAENLDFYNVIIFTFSFLKNLLLGKEHNITEINELIFGYFTNKINEIINHQNLIDKKFLNLFPKKILVHSQGKIYADELLNLISNKILLNFQNENLLKTLFLNGEYLNIYYFISYNFTLLFLFNIEHIYNKKFTDSTKEILILKNFDFFRLIQEFILTIKYPDTSEKLTSNKENSFTILQKVFELFCQFSNNIKIGNLFISDNLYDKKYFNNSNKIMLVETLKDKFYTSNFFFIIKKLFLCDSDQINHKLSLQEEKEENKGNRINQVLIIRSFSHLYNDFIYNGNFSNNIEFNFNDFNNKFNVLKLIEIIQFFELNLKVHKIPLIYCSLFEQILWPEFSKLSGEIFTRRIIQLLISYLFKLFLNDDNVLKYDQTKNIMNWLYAILDPKFNVDKISPIDRVLALYGIIDLCKFDLNFISTIKGFLIDILKNIKIEDFPEDLKNKLENKYSIKFSEFEKQIKNGKEKII